VENTSSMIIYIYMYNTAGNTDNTAKNTSAFAENTADNTFATISDNTDLYYGVATGNRLLKMIGLFCRIKSYYRALLAKETCDFKEPTNRSHSIS